jgi:energy-converting hydrogenase Eha subunit G
MQRLKQSAHLLTQSKPLGASYAVCSGRLLSSGTQRTRGEEEVATTKWGSPVFRAINFELYAKPTGWMKVFAFAGSGLFVGVATYFTFYDATASGRDQSL